MNTVLVVQNEDADPPCLLGDWLEQAGVTLEVRRPHHGEDVGPGRVEHDALIVLGGSMGAADDAAHPWLAQVRELIRGYADAGRPVLGICLGHQLCAVAFGGAIAPSPNGTCMGATEVGWLPETADDPLLGAMTGVSRAIHWNNDVVTELPEGARVLARVASGEVQAVRYQELVWGVQWHPEVDAETFVSWCDQESGTLTPAQVAAKIAEVRADEAVLTSDWKPLADRIVGLLEASAPRR